MTLAELCAEVLRRKESGSQAFTKLLPRLFRQAAVELRRRGWNPFELLMSLPDEPSTPEDMAPGGVTTTNGTRRRWLHTPEKELELLTEVIARRIASGKSIAWHKRRAETLLGLLQAQTFEVQP